MQSDTRRSLIFTLLGGVIFFFITNRVIGVWLATPPLEKGTAMINSIMTKLDVFATGIIDDPFKIFGGKAFFWAVVVTAFIMFGINMKSRFKKPKREGEEYGSAKWGNKANIKPYLDKNPDNNIIMTETESLSMSGRMSPPKYNRNKNVLIVGGSGSGKTRNYVKPNLMQLHSSYVITDPKGTLLPECGKLFEEAGYKIRSLNTINFAKSNHYNPLSYIRSEKDILKVVNVLIENTSGQGSQKNEDFWVKAERLYYGALIGYMHERCMDEEKNMISLQLLLSNSVASEENEEFKNPIDILFDEYEEELEATGRDPMSSFAVSQYKDFKLAAGKTTKSILISCAARLAPFKIAELRGICESDELQLDKIGDEKTAFFVIMSDTDTTFNFLVAMMYYQMFNLLCDHADDDCGGRLPVHVRCILDEFANIGKIPNFEKLIATIRSREISASIILQSISQLKSVYKDDAETIMDNCDSFLFLGGKSEKTTESISKMLGKATIENVTHNITKSNGGSWTENHQILGRELLMPDEISSMDRDYCLFLMAGERPFKSKKYPVEKHKRYKFLADSDKENIYVFDRAKSIRDENLKALPEPTPTRPPKDRPPRPDSPSRPQRKVAEDSEEAQWLKQREMAREARRQKGWADNSKEGEQKENTAVVIRRKA